MTVVSEDLRAHLYDLQRSVNDARASRLSSVRSYRNLLRTAIFLLLVAAVVLPLVVPPIAPDLGVLRPPAIAGGPPIPMRWQDLVGIEVWGAVGGLVGLVVALRKLVATNAPLTLQWAQLALKIPAGALTAVFGTLIVQSTLVPSVAPATATQLTAYALIFGFAQEAATAMVDRTAGQLLEQSKTTNEATTGSST